MAMTSDAEERRAEREATGWLIALREEPSDAALRARFDAWLASAPAHRAAWRETGKIDALIGHARPALGRARSPELGGAASSPVDLASERTRRRSPRRGLVAVAAVAAGLLLVFVPGVLLWFEAAHVTSVAEIRTLPLDDGSVLRLGARSAVDIAYTPSERRVRLLRGEAFFDVVRDERRPFVVESGDVRTTVLGTSFEVRLADEGIDVAVRSGLVDVVAIAARPPISERLTAGDRVHVAGGQVARRTGGAGDVAPWLEGQIVARDRSVAAIVDELRRHHRGAIVIANGRLARERVTGVYDLADPVAALRAVASAHGATVHEIGPWLTIVSKK